MPVKPLQKVSDFAGHRLDAPTWCVSMVVFFCPNAPQRLLIGKALSLLLSMHWAPRMPALVTAKRSERHRVHTRMPVIAAGAPQNVKALASPRQTMSAATTVESGLSAAFPQSECLLQCTWFPDALYCGFTGKRQEVMVLWTFGADAPPPEAAASAGTTSTVEVPFGPTFSMRVGSAGSDAAVA